MKVWPKNDEMRKILVHPSGNIAFHDEGPVDWPDDSFTHRRVMDGDVTLEDRNRMQAAPAKKAPDAGKV